MKPEKLAEAFNKDAETVDSKVRSFLVSSDPTNTQELRKAARRLATAYSVLPRKLRKDSRVKSYVKGARKLAKATGKVRDLDTIAAWTSQIPDAKDKRLFLSDLEKLRAQTLRPALSDAKELRNAKTPRIGSKRLEEREVERRTGKVEEKLVKRVDGEFEEFLSTQEVEVMHALRKDSKRLRHLLELVKNGHSPSLVTRLRSIQDDLGAIRDHDLVIEYLRSRVKPTSTRPLIREEIAKRHARLEDFVTKNRGQGRVVPVPAKKKSVN